ncbi:pentapeptide repeat-containing protein [Streptomyces sp. WG5]|uniref:pentapeptide repeat-containing protein n=1 Tax=Streptomyces sp. WG5 TaxID=3417648 RepID=UPI003CF0E8EF
MAVLFSSHDFSAEEAQHRSQQLEQSVIRQVDSLEGSSTMSGQLSSNTGGVIELSGIREVRMMPPGEEAAAALQHWTAQPDAPLDASGLDLSGVDLSGADLAMALLIQSALRNARLVGADFYRARLEGAALDQADLTEASLVKAELDEASLRSATLDRADLGSASLWAVDARSACFRSAKLDGASFIGARLEGADLTNASVRETSLKVVLDERTVVAGLFGTLFGPVVIEEAGGRREVDGADLEQWLNRRGAQVRVLQPRSHRITYYAKVSEGYSRGNPQGIVRRRIVNGVAHDEAFTRNLCWEPTEYLRLYELGHNEVERVEISEAEALAFVDEVTAGRG